MHIELTEMLRCPEPHRQALLVLATGEMSGRMVRRGVVGCPVCQREYEIVDGIVYFGGTEKGEGGTVVASAPLRPSPFPVPDVLHALLDLSSPGGYVAVLGLAARAGAELA